MEIAPGWNTPPYTPYVPWNTISILPPQCYFLCPNGHEWGYGVHIKALPTVCPVCGVVLH